MSVVGIGGCGGGWIAIALGDASKVRGSFIERLDELLDVIPDVQAVAIDIPIGLPSIGRRRAEAEARALLGARRNSVFYAPVRRAITAQTYAEANAISRAVTGQGISAQAFALVPRIREAERWSADAPVPVWEVHPEVSFAIMPQHPAESPKRTWAGLQERQRALETSRGRCRQPTELRNCTASMAMLAVCWISRTG